MQLVYLDLEQQQIWHIRADAAGGLLQKDDQFCLLCDTLQVSAQRSQSSLTIQNHDTLPRVQIFISLTSGS